MNRIGVLSLLISVGLFIGCEDPVPSDYEPEYIFTGYLIVDNPIQDIRVTLSQAPVDTFRYNQATVDDALIRIWNDRDTFVLAFREGDGETFGEYYAPDQAKLVEPNTTYMMEAVMSDGTRLTGQTTTPGRISWIDPPKDVLQYPVDTVNLPSPDSLRLKWTQAEGVVEYLISIECLDTLGYGTYLTPPTQEQNRRIERFFEDDAPRYDDRVRWGFLQNTEAPTFWFAFKWFGRQQITVYAPDENYNEWYKQVEFGGNSYSTLLGSIDGGIGVFGSASIATSETFVLKNQP